MYTVMPSLTLFAPSTGLHHQRVMQFDHHHSCYPAGAAGSRAALRFHKGNRGLLWVLSLIRRICAASGVHLFAILKYQRSPSYHTTAADVQHLLLARVAAPWHHPLHLPGVPCGSSAKWSEKEWAPCPVSEEENGEDADTRPRSRRVSPHPGYEYSMYSRCPGMPGREVRASCRC